MMGKFNSKKVDSLKKKGIKEDENKGAKEDKNKKVKKKKRSYMLRIETIKKLKMIEMEEVESDITLSEIVDQAINDYYKNVYSKEEENKRVSEPVEGQTKIDC